MILQLINPLLNFESHQILCAITIRTNHGWALQSGLSMLALDWDISLGDGISTSIVTALQRLLVEQNAENLTEKPAEIITELISG